MTVHVLILCTHNSARSVLAPSNADGGDADKRRAFELTRQAVGYRMLQLLALPLETMDRAELHEALAGIGRT